MLVQSILSRIAVVCGLALVIVALPFLLLLSVEGDWFEAQTLATTEPSAKVTPTSIQNEIAEEPSVQIASLSVGTAKPNPNRIDFPAPLQASTKDYIEMASDLAKQRQFKQALGALDQIHASNRNDYAVKFLEARILSWYGKHAEAGHQFETLRGQYPENLDILVSYGYLKFYQRNYVEAEALFVEVLTRNPDYHDARTGLDRARTANKRN